MKKYFGFVLGAFSLYLVLNIFPSNLIAQSNFFPLGLFNYDVRGREYLITETNEMTNIQGLHANYLTAMSYRAQPGIIDTCNDLAGAIRAVVDHDDTTGGYYYPVWDVRHDRYNTILWRYISDNHDYHIRMDSVEIFINRVYNRYQTNHAGLGGILVAHQGETHDPNHWPFIRRAGRVIQQRFGDAVRSVVIDNSTSIDWTAAALEDFFSNDTTSFGGVGYSLDVYQHEYYPFYEPAAYIGDDFQNLLDARFIYGCELTRSALNASGNTHTRLEMYIQTHSAYFNNTYFRRPTEAEIWVQAFLALSRNFKGIHCYVYRTAPPGSYEGQPAWYDSGLVDIAVPRNPINDSFNHQPYNNVAQLFAHLSSLGPQLLPLDVDTAFTWTGSAPPDYPLIQEITGYALDGSHHTIEVSLMDHPTNNYDYFLLVNRRCSSDNNGTPAPAQTITVRTNKTGQYQIRDLYSGELFVSSDGYFRNITIDPGRGRLFELRQMFVNNESWANTINVSSNINVPTGKMLTIAANSLIKFYTNTELKAQGKLTANGTTTQHIKFTSAATTPARGNWKWIKFDNYWSSSSLN